MHAAICSAYATYNETKIKHVCKKFKCMNHKKDHNHQESIHNIKIEFFHIWSCVWIRSGTLATTVLLRLGNLTTHTREDFLREYPQRYYTFCSDINENHPQKTSINLKLIAKFSFLWNKPESEEGPWAKNNSSA